MHLKSVTIAECGISTKELAEQVRAVIESNWAGQADGVIIDDFTLVKKSKNEYRGILKISGGEAVGRLCRLAALVFPSFVNCAEGA
jgi:hypothetical protein